MQEQTKQTSRFKLIRKNYLTYLNARNKLLKESDLVVKKQLKRRCASIQLNCQLLLDLADDLSDDEQILLTAIKNKNIPEDI